MIFKVKRIPILKSRQVKHHPLKVNPSYLKNLPRQLCSTPQRIGRSTTVEKPVSPKSFRSTTKASPGPPVIKRSRASQCVTLSMKLLTISRFNTLTARNLNLCITHSMSRVTIQRWFTSKKRPSQTSGLIGMSINR